MHGAIQLPLPAIGIDMLINGFKRLALGKQISNWFLQEALDFGPPYIGQDLPIASRKECDIG
jgi:hypothetical protein